VSASSRKPNADNRLLTNIFVHFDLFWEQVPGGLAARKGRILQGDCLLEINGQDVKKKSQTEVAAMLRASYSDTLTIHIPSNIRYQ
jgi:C-terminal processing protease CtpA/Prc